MQLTTILTTALACASSATAALNWSLEKASNPTTDQADAYSKIESAMRDAVARYHRSSPNASKTIRVYYAPGVPTAEASFNGDLRFGSNRAYMNTRTAMHEISHTLGVGTTNAFNNMCSSGNWPKALPLLRSFDGQSAVINCGGSHFWPYGLNYDNEWSETNAERHVRMVDAMIQDGIGRG
ncbi:hypothetical protein MCOR25_005513 [Pyricularia grisea]|uniref:Ricin B lectin n=1 Tax=Pyricularia grisea TaxID=148305 RepID=A0A6P8AZP1_PYRGI|nr:hypothetical protein PgNI_10177 [Pyricularia grisea]KAI6365021.1 hypothetical protein MCOR25_005513 [Pyricularia grisea]TLD07774.1 hypothetical protein PgNI_10177 [Pyricularia grisea]